MSEGPPKTGKGFAPSAAADGQARGRGMSWWPILVAAVLSASLASAVTYVVVTRLADRAALSPTAPPPDAGAPADGGPPIVIQTLPAVLTRPVVTAEALGYPSQLWPTLAAGADVLCEAIALDGERPEWKKSEFFPDLWECLSFSENAAEGYTLFAMVRGAEETRAGEIRLKLSIDGTESTVAQELALADLARRVGEALGPLLAGVLERTVGRTDGGSDIAYNTEFTVIRELGGGPGRDVVVTLPERFATRYATDRLRPRSASPMAR